MGPALALHALLAGGHGQQPTVKKQPAPALPTLPGKDPRAGALLSLLQSQQMPQQPPNPQPTGEAPPLPPKAPKKVVNSHPVDSNAGL